MTTTVSNDDPINEFKDEIVTGWLIYMKELHAKYASEINKVGLTTRAETQLANIFGPRSSHLLKMYMRYFSDRSVNTNFIGRISFVALCQTVRDFSLDAVKKAQEQAQQQEGQITRNIVDLQTSIEAKERIILEKNAEIEILRKHNTSLAADLAQKTSDLANHKSATNEKLKQEYEKLLTLEKNVDNLKNQLENTSVPPAGVNCTTSIGIQCNINTNIKGSAQNKKSKKSGKRRIITNRQKDDSSTVIGGESQSGTNNSADHVKRKKKSIKKSKGQKAKDHSGSWNSDPKELHTSNTVDQALLSKEKRELVFYDIPKFFSKADIIKVLSTLGCVESVKACRAYKYYRVRASITLYNNWDNVYKSGGANVVVTHNDRKFLFRWFEKGKDKNMIRWNYRWQAIKETKDHVDVKEEADFITKHAEKFGALFGKIIKIQKKQYLLLYFINEDALMKAVNDSAKDVTEDTLQIKGRNEILSHNGRYEFNRRTRKYDPIVHEPSEDNLRTGADNSSLDSHDEDMTNAPPPTVQEDLISRAEIIPKTNLEFASRMKSLNKETDETLQEDRDKLVNGKRALEEKTVYCREDVSDSLD